MLTLLFLCTPVPAADAALEAELGRFPHAALVADYLQFNRSYRDTLLDAWVNEPAHRAWLEATIAVTDRLHAAWLDLARAQCAWEDTTDRWAALGRLRARLGEADYGAGRMPVPVPTDAFQEVRPR